MAGADTTCVVVLAAGDGKRLKSELPKVLHRAAGRPLLAHVLAALQPLRPAQTIVVVSPRRAEIEDAMRAAGFGTGITYVVQDPPRGTADAVRVALAEVLPEARHIVVLYGDAPTVSTETLADLVEAQEASGAAATMLTTQARGRSGLGRVVRDERGVIERIVEEKDAAPEELEIDEVNPGIYAFDRDALALVVDKVDTENVQGELYLTDVVALLRARGDSVETGPVDAGETLGVNTRAELAEVAAVLRDRIAARHMEAGVAVVDPSSTFIDVTATIEPGATIHPFSFIEGTSSVGAGAEVGPQVRLVDSEVGRGATVSFAVVRGSTIGPEASVGPFASLRPGTRLERGARAGTFVETKNTTIGEDSKANHLAYLGDAQIGRGVNIGAGTITTNWDGERKHATIIEDDAYISSDTMLVAPVKVGRRGATGAGAVVRDDVPDDALAVGVPARIIEGKGDRMKRGEGAPRE